MVWRYGLIGGSHDDGLRLAKQLTAAHPGLPLKFCYEAGAHGYPLARCLYAHGHEASSSPPSEIPTVLGDRVKTSRRVADPEAVLVEQRTATNGLHQARIASVLTNWTEVTHDAANGRGHVINTTPGG